MEGSSSSSKKKKKPAAGEACGGKPTRPHWRHRDPADTSVYVVHPDQFRAVVQQLTGAAASSPAVAPRQQGANEGTTEAQQTTQQATGGTGTNAQQHAGGGEENSGSNRVKTLAQLHDECMAWANADD